MATEDEALSGELVDETARLDLDELCALCGVQADRVVEMSSGRIVADGPPPGGRAEISALQW